MLPSSRTPEGESNQCPVCGRATVIEPSWPAGDAPCPSCGHLVWFTGAEPSLTDWLHQDASEKYDKSLDRLMDALPAVTRQIILLHTLGKDDQEIAATLSVPRRAVRRALMMFRVMAESAGPPED